ncbi:MAG: MBL fold metallo-hydrolase [Clostridia bacterium]|nr:MBL fold metallo-hydrolase [Clostridia bacterium]
MINKKKSIVTMIIMGIVILISSVAYMIFGPPESIKLGEGELSDAEVAIHIIDVGQGDAAFIENGDHDILIDAGPGDSAEKLLEYLDGLGVYEIDYAFFSHPHEDHIGGADDVISHYKVNNVIMPDYYEETACYRRLMQGIDYEGAELVYAAAGDKFTIDDITVEIFSPGPRYKPDNANAISFIMKVSYGEIDAMFTGDAETGNEDFALRNYGDALDCEILKVGHHGSSTSTSEDFLYAVSPEVAVISVGEDNSYGHPHIETLSLLNSYMDNIYRTDRHGDIVFGMTKDKYWIVE